MDMLVEAAPGNTCAAPEEPSERSSEQAGIKVDIKPVELVKGVTMFFRTKEAMATNFRWTGRPDPDRSGAWDVPLRRLL